MVAWAYFTMPTEEELRRQQEERARQDSIEAVQQDTPQAEQTPEEDFEEPQDQAETLRQEEEEAPDQMGQFSRASLSDTTYYTVETPQYNIVFTNVGAGPAKLELKDYQTWNDQPVQMIADTTQSTYSAEFLSSGNFNVETDQLVFEQVTPGTSTTLQNGETTTVEYALNISDTQRILYTYTLQGDRYEIDLDITFEGLERDIIGSVIDFGWKSRLNLTEKDITQETVYTSAYAYLGGELEQLLLSEAGREERNFNGTIDWVATRTKFFSQIIKTSAETESALLIGEVSGEPDNVNTRHRYQSFVSTVIPENGTIQYQLYAGPLDYHTLQEFDEQAYDMVDVGYALIRWFSDPLVRWMVIPFFQFAGNYMNYGFAIILFAVAIKLILYPLTKKSYKSMAAMKELQPQMKEIQEKYEDDPKKQQEATLKLYKEAGVNPLGGCLPNLLQLPILITLWRYFQNSIMIRQEEFLWATDLSAPDYILSLPFSVPFLGDQLAGFVLLMTAAMFAQSKLTGGMGGGMGGGPTGGSNMPNMKALQYIFPFMLLFIFNNFAAGLSLYYLIYNVMSIGQQLLIYRQIDKEKETAEVTA